MQREAPIVVMGGSAGAVEGLLRIAQGLPKDFPTPVLCVLHSRAHNGSTLPRLISRGGRLPAVHATDGEKLRNGHIYIAPPDYHMLVHNGTIELTRGAREHGFRPAIDPLFRSAAASYGPGIVGVLLSGALDDGVLGLASIKQHGGTTVVQNPAEAPFPSMPASAIQHVQVDHVADVADMPALLSRLMADELKARPAGRIPAAASGGEDNGRQGFRFHLPRLRRDTVGGTGGQADAL